VHAVAVDSQGSIYCAGWTSSFGAGWYDTLLLKYDSSGTLAWARTWGGSNDDYLCAVAVTPGGNIYCAGYTQCFGAGWWDALLLKYSSSGALVWARTWGGGYSNYLSAVAVDSLGSAYCAGETDSFGAGERDALLLKYDSSGTVAWVRTWGGTELDYLCAVAVDFQGDIYCSGVTDSFGAGWTNALLLKYDSSGTLQWAKTWGGSYRDYLYAAALDSAGNLYAGGRTSSYAGTWQEVITGTETYPSGSESLPGGAAGSPSGTEGNPTGTESSPTGDETGAGYADTLLLKNW
jgi:hypothetical protein